MSSNAPPSPLGYPWSCSPAHSSHPQHYQAENTFPPPYFSSGRAHPYTFLRPFPYSNQRPPELTPAASVPFNFPHHFPGQPAVVSTHLLHGGYRDAQSTEWELESSGGPAPCTRSWSNSPTPSELKAVPMLDVANSPPPLTPPYLTPSPSPTPMIGVSSRLSEPPVHQDPREIKDIQPRSFPSLAQFASYPLTGGPEPSVKRSPELLRCWSSLSCQQV